MAAVDKFDVLAREGEPEVDLSVPHPLQYGWTFTLNAGESKGSVGKHNFGDGQKKLVTMSTVEDFLKAFKSLPEPADLSVNSTIYMFKEGIMPKWEDPANAGEGAGRFKLTVKRKGGTLSQERKINERWAKTILLGIGEGFDVEESEQINGYELQIKPAEFRIGIWTKGCPQETLDGIEQRWKDTVLESPTEDWNLQFQRHNDPGAERKNSRGGGGFRASRAEDRI